MARMQKASFKKAPLINDWIVPTQKKKLADAYAQNFPRFRGLPGSESIRDILILIFIAVQLKSFRWNKDKSLVEGK